MHKVWLLSELEENEESRAMARAQRRLDEEIERLDELETYRGSYRSQASPAAGSMQWTDYRNFLGRLDQAVAMQSNIVQEARQTRDVQRARWLERRRKKESLERVVERFRDEESAERERRLQATDDETARNLAEPAR